MEREREKRGRERGPCPEQLKPPGQPGQTDSQHHRLQGASSSGKPSADPPSVSCGGEEVREDAKQHNQGSQTPATVGPVLVGVWSEGEAGRNVELRLDQELRVQIVKGWGSASQTSSAGL